jgi:hypothetical protein
MLWIAIHRYHRVTLRKIERKFAGRSFLPVKESGRGYKEHASGSIFCKWRNDVRGDSSDEQDLKVAIGKSLDAVRRRNPERALRVLVENANSVVDRTVPALRVRFLDLGGTLGNRLRYGLCVCLGEREQRREAD